MDDKNSKKTRVECDEQNNRACQLANEGNYEESIKLFKELLVVNPYDFRALANKATIEGKSGLPEEALDRFEKIVTANPHDLHCRLVYIQLLTELGKYERALECYRQMPRSGVMTYMLLGSLPEDVKQLLKIQSYRGTMEETIRKMEKYRAKVKAGKPVETSPECLALLWAPVHEPRIEMVLDMVQ